MCSILLRMDFIFGQLRNIALLKATTTTYVLSIEILYFSMGKNRCIIPVYKERLGF
jgi:hypothetical protein